MRGEKLHGTASTSAGGGQFRRLSEVWLKAAETTRSLRKRCSARCSFEIKSSCDRRCRTRFRCSDRRRTARCPEPAKSPGLLSQGEAQGSAEPWHPREAASRRRVPWGNGR